MDQTQTVDNDLQKAIDDITKTTSIDPVFSDPVAAPSSVPEGDTGELGEPNGPFPEPVLETPPAPAITTTHPEPEPAEPVASIEPIEVPDLPPAPAPDPIPEMPAPEIEPIPQTLNTSEVKKAALRDLVPILNKVSMSDSQKFKIYRDIFDVLKDYTVLEPAYRAAREIPDEAERAKALLYLVESIDKM